MLSPEASPGSRREGLRLAGNTIRAEVNERPPSFFFVRSDSGVFPFLRKKKYFITFCVANGYRISLNVMTLKVTSNQVNSTQGVPISVTGIAQVEKWRSGVGGEKNQSGSRRFRRLAAEAVMLGKQAQARRGWWSDGPTSRVCRRSFPSKWITSTSAKPGVYLPYHKQEQRFPSLISPVVLPMVRAYPTNIGILRGTVSVVTIVVVSTGVDI